MIDANENIESTLHKDNSTNGNLGQNERIKGYSKEVIGRKTNVENMETYIFSGSIPWMNKNSATTERSFAVALMKVKPDVKK